MRWFVAMIVLAGCASSKPGTHVELVEKGGQNTYVTGAAAPGQNQGVACRAAVRRAVAAIAERFADEQEDIGEDVAKSVGVEDGGAFLQRYAMDAALSGAVQDVKFDPMEHHCVATITWTPPVFVKEAVLAFAEQLKRTETTEAQPKPASSGAPTLSETAAAPPTATPPPMAVSVAPPASAAPLRRCTREHDTLRKVQDDNEKVIAEFKRCLSKTGGDETICHRYKLYVEKAADQEMRAGEKLTGCLNSELGAKTRLALERALPGHAGVAVETRADGTLILWTFSPVDQRAFVLDVSADGRAGSPTALAANQVEWVKEKLGFAP